MIAAAAYAKASGDEEAANNARKIFTKCIEYATTPGILPPKFSGKRPSIGIGVPMILMNTAQQLRDTIGDPRCDDLIDGWIDTIEKYFVKDDIEKVHISGIDQELQMGGIEEAGYVDLKAFLDAAFIYFQKNAKVVQEDFDFSQLSLVTGNPEYRGIEYDALIFCEGYHVHQNPYFSFLPFKPVNGDVLTLKIPSYQYAKCFNKNFFLLPLHDGNYRLGATYNWSNLVFETNDDAKNELLSRVQQYIKGEITVVQHEAGVRPSSNDRRPILGAHPQQKNIYIFNGLGAKGVMLAPYFAQQLAAHITQGKTIEKEVSVERYYRLQQSL